MWMIQAYSNLGLHPKLEKNMTKLPNNVQLRILTHEKMQEKTLLTLQNLKLDQCKLQEAIFPNQPTKQPNPQNSSFWMATTLPLMTFNPVEAPFRNEKTYPCQWPALFLLIAAI